MSYTRAAGKLTLDNAHADGRITAHGIGRDWKAAEDKDLGTTYTPDLSLQSGWEYAGLFEYLSPLRAIAPRGTFTRADMALSGWTVESGLWEESSAAGYLRTVHLSYYDGRANRYAVGMHGSILSNASYAPAVMLWLWRIPGDPTDTEPALVEVQFVGDGSIPEVCLGLPSRDVSSDYWTDNYNETSRELAEPYLSCRPQGQPFWKVVERFRGGGASQRVSEAGDGVHFEAYSIEYDDGYILVNHSGASETWSFHGSYKDVNDVSRTFAMTTGPIRVRVTGHRVLFALAQVTYPDASVLRPWAALYAPAPWNPTPAYAVVAAKPAGTDITVAAESASAEVKWPAATFTTSGSLRPVLYAIQEYRTATIGGAVSSPVSSDGRDTLKVMSMSGHLSERWRGATLEAEIRAVVGSEVDYLYPNSKVAAEVSCDDGSSYSKLFTGYVSPGKEIEDGMGRGIGKLRATDGIEARLTKKLMYGHCSYGGWGVKDAFEHILNRAGVAAAQISTHVSISPAGMGALYYLPEASSRGERNLEFDANTDVVSALDLICELRDLQWGVDNNGLYFLRPWPTYSGTPDFTLDQDTTTAEDVFAAFRMDRIRDDFRNALVVLAGEGLNMTARVWMDGESMGTDSAHDYIGDDWWEVVTRPEGDDVLKIGRKRWELINTNAAQVVYWKTNHHPELLPGDHVKAAHVDNVDIYADAVYRITQKAWRIDAGSGMFEQELECVLVQGG